MTKSSMEYSKSKESYTGSTTKHFYENHNRNRSIQSDTNRIKEIERKTSSCIKDIPSTSIDKRIATSDRSHKSQNSDTNPKQYRNQSSKVIITRQQSNKLKTVKQNINAVSRNSVSSQLSTASNTSMASSSSIVASSNLNAPSGGYHLELWSQQHPPQQRSKIVPLATRKNSNKNDSK
ncbi:hypothetical protein NH340_JMT02466 [Sarcoptes scabiei]|nr:hypothetical protein NH340_JMT02466 [Sarcoptes scabiei]